MSSARYYPSPATRLAARRRHQLACQFGNLDTAVAAGADAQPLVGPMLDSLVRAAIDGDLCGEGFGRGGGESRAESRGRILARLTRQLTANPEQSSYHY
jgi:hypothetical protein